MNSIGKTEGMSRNFLKLDRGLRDRFIRKEFTLNEFIILIWLQLNANPYNGEVKTSYSALVDDFRGTIRKNTMNKIILALRKKKHLWFKRNQGGRSSFMIKMNNFPTVNGVTDLEIFFTKNGIGSAEPTREESGAENHQSYQKPKNADYPSNEIKIAHEHETNRRSAYIDKEERDNSIDTKKQRMPRPMPIGSFFPTNDQEEICRDIAMDLGETDMKYLLSRLAMCDGKADFISEAWRRLKSKHDYKLKNRRKYYNKILENILEENGLNKV